MTTPPATAATPPPVAATMYSDLRSGSGKLMLHQRGALAVKPADLQSRFVGMETSLDAFSGIFLRLPTVSDSIMRNTPVQSAAITSELAPLSGLVPKKLRFNFAIVTAQHDLDPFDDWKTVIANFASLARAAKAAGLVGIVIDNESPTGMRVNYPSDINNTNRSLAEYRTQTQLNSKLIMQALVAEFPEIAVVVLRGPAASEPLTPLQVVVPSAQTPSLLGPFFAGLVAGKGSQSMVVDGGNDYGLRFDDQFAASTDWRKNGIASDTTNSAFLGSAQRVAWPTTANVSFGVRERDGWDGNGMANVMSIWESTISTAMRQADTFAWASFDTTDMTKAATTDPFVVASRRAKAAAASPSAHLASVAPGTGTGLTAQYFQDNPQDAQHQVYLARTRIDAVVDNYWTGDRLVAPPIAPLQLSNYSVVWSGYVEIPIAGNYTFFGSTDDGMRITVGGQPVFGDDGYHSQGTTEYMGDIFFTAGGRYPIKIEFFQGGGGSEAHVSWQAQGGDKVIIPTTSLYPSN